MKSFAYDEIGNFLTYYNGSAYSFTWEGRNLVGATKGSTNMSFTYDDNGIRTSKTVNGVEHIYYLNGSQIVAEKWGERLLVYLYDAAGSPIGMMFRKTSYAEGEFDVYWFTKNLQGDILSVYNESGQQVAYYSYSDAWGNHTAYVTTTAIEGAQYNPFRYRGYYYDTDLGMYYLQSRYYDAKICRFINADSALYGTMLGYNLFAYCENNPITRADPTGRFWFCDDIELDEDDMMERGGGGSGGYGYGSYYGPGTAYYNYAVRRNTASYDAHLGGYYFGGGSYIGGYTGQFAIGTVSVTDGMATSSSIHGLCFVAGTVVKTAEGDVTIENIQVGDYVYAHNPETGETELKPVVQTFVNEATELVHVFADGEEIICTNEHPFYSPVKGWTEACKLRAGDILVSLNGEYIVVEQVQHEILETPIKVYNFEVEDFHTYFVGDGDGVLVHNECGWSSIVENSNAYNTVKHFDKQQTAKYENALTKLASGNTSGLNIHTLSNGMRAADLTGFGKGRGAARIIYQVLDGVVEIFEVNIKHYKK